MTYRTPLVLAISMVLLGLTWFVVIPSLSKTEEDNPSGPVLTLGPEERMLKLEVEAKGKPTLVIERHEHGVSYLYDIVQPIQKMADKFMGDDVLYTLHRQEKAGRLKAKSKPMSEFGLEEPRVVVTVQTDKQKLRLKFGKENPFEENGMRYVYYAIEGDGEWVYQMFKPYFESFMRTAADWRSKQMLDLQIDQVQKCTLITSATTIELELREEGPRSFAWFLNKPFPEMADGNHVVQMLTAVSKLRALEFFNEGEAPKFGLDAPALRVYLEERGSTKKIELRFGKEEKREDKPCVYAIEGDSREIALCDAEEFKHDVKTTVDDYRNRSIFFLRPEELTAMEIDCYKLGKMTLALDEVQDVDPRGRPMRRQQHIVKEPPGVMVLDNQELRRQQWQAIEQFVENVTRMEALEFVGRQMELPASFFEKVEAKMTYYVTRGTEKSERVFYFKQEDKKTLCTRAEGNSRYEQYLIPSIYLSKLKLLELNFQLRPLVNIKGEQITALRIQTTSKHFPTYEVYKIYEDPDHVEHWKGKPEKEGWEFDETRARGLAELVARLEPLVYVSKSEADMETFDLRNPAHIVQFTYEEPDPANPKAPRSRNKVLKISDEVGDSIYYAKFDDRPEIFQVSPQIAVTVEKGVFKRTPR